MKKRTVTKLLSCMLAFSMVATAAPVTAWADEIPAAHEALEDAGDEGQAAVQEDTGEVQEDTKQEDTGVVEEPEDLGNVEADVTEGAATPEPEAIVGRSIAVDGKYDDWAQDPATVKGNDAINEVTDAGFLHLQSGSQNGNSVTDANQYPAMFLNPKTFDFTQDGYFEYDVWPMLEAKDTRFGFYFDYDTPAKGMFIGYDSGGWFWQKYGVEGNPYAATGVAAPAKGTWTKVRVEWTAEGKFSLYVGGQKAIDNLDSGMTHNSEGKIAIKCGTFQTAYTNMYFNNIYYPGQDTVEGNHITGKVVDDNGNPVAGATVATGKATAQTAEDGTYDLEVLDGTHTVTASKEGYVSAEISVPVDGGNAVADDIVLYVSQGFETRTLTTEEMDVKVARDFPSIVQYEMKKGDLKDKIFYGQTERLMNIKINGVSIKVKKDDIKATFTDKAATYEMKLKGENIDCVLTAVISVEGNTASFDITNVKNNLTELDENGYVLYPVQSIEIPNHSLISVNSSQTNAHLKGAKMSSDTRRSGDRDFDVVNGMTLTNGASSEDFMYAFINNNEMSAGLWSNSENSGTNVASYIGGGGADNTRVIANATTAGEVTTLGLSSAKWYYDRRVSTPVVIGNDDTGTSTTEERTYVVGHDIMPSAKIVITGDENGDNDIDWQDGAVGFRSIMHNPFKCEEVPELVNYRIAMNFGSQAANPFLMNLDGVKRVYLNTEGLGQGVLLKGYGSEGHDSGHPDYGDIGRRIGGAEDMNKLLVEGKKMGALFGVHVNASEMYTEAKAFSNELSRGYNGIASGWNWLDQGIGINARYDLATKSRENRFKDLYNQVGENLDFIYVDVWGNGVNDSGTSGDSYEDAWASRMLAREINRLGWRFTTEWGPTQEYDSTLQHWAADLAYGGYQSKGENSAVMRFLRNHQKDSWIADYPSYDGAAQSPLLGGLNMTDFEGWQGRINLKNYITVMFRHNVITKYLQHYQVVDWEDGTPVTLNSGETWTPEMEITLRNTKDETDNTELVVTRKSNDYADLANYRSRTITLNGVTISEGAPTGGDGSNPGNEKYLIPWNWDFNGDKLADADKKLYHWNTNGGTSTWTLTKDWEGLSNVVLYKLTDEGKTDKTVVNVVNNQITLENIEAEIPYVIYKGEKAPLAVDWQTTKYVYDTGFNDPDINSHRTISGEGTASIADNAGYNNMLKLEGEVSVSTKITNLKKGQKYALYVGVDNRSDSKAHVTVKYGSKVLATNYATRSFAQNYVKSDQHHTNVGTEAGSNVSYFQNMYVFFTAEGGTATLSFDREAGAGATYFDDIRVVETTMDPILEKDEEGNPTVLFNDFEDNAQGIWPFVISNTEGVEDNRIHLSERHGEYTQAGYMCKKVDDVIDGDWSVKINGLSQRNNLIYQTVPENFRFEPGETYYVSFDYQMGSNRAYEVRLGDGTERNVQSWDLAAAAGETKRFGGCFTAGESGNNWIGIFSTVNGTEDGGLTGKKVDFAGFKDFILDNLRIEKVEGGMSIDKTYTEVTTSKDKIDLSAIFTEGVDPNTDVTWTSYDEDVARVNSNGTVMFVDFGSALIRATAKIGGKEVSAVSVVYYPDRYTAVDNPELVWVNTEEPSGEGSGSGRGVHALDGDPNSIWHSNWSGDRFTVSEDNPAILTVKYTEDISNFNNLGFMQRPSGGSNGLVKKYECIVGSAYDEESMTVTGENGAAAYTTGVVNAEKTKNGETELFEFPEGTHGNYLQIRVLQGQSNYAAIAEILVNTVISYDTEEERASMQDNLKEIEAELQQVKIAQDELKAALEAAGDIYAGGESFYSAESWSNFETVYHNVLASESTNPTRLAQLKDTLLDAQNGLVELTESEKRLEKALKDLKTALEVAQPVYDAGQNDYSNATWKAFTKAFDAAKAGQSSTDAEELEKLKVDLVAAQDSLKNVTESEREIEAAQRALSDKINAAKAIYDAGQNDYSDATWEAFEEAYVEAQLGVDSLSISKLNRLSATLEKAQSELKKADETDDVKKQLEEAREELLKVIAKADPIFNAGMKNYTTSSWEEFESAYTSSLTAKKTGSISKLKRLTERLTNAINDLEEKMKVGDTITVGKVKYKVTSTTKKTVTAVKGTDKNATSISLASTVRIKGETCKVTKIEPKAFYKYTKLKDIYISRYVTSIGKSSFQGCTKLSRVTIGKSVTTIGESAFNGCTALKEIAIGKKVSKIGKKAFYNCKNLKKVQYLATAVKKIETQAFKKTNAKMTVTVPKGTSTKTRNNIKSMMIKAGMNKKATVK